METDLIRKWEESGRDSAARTEAYQRHLRRCRRVVRRSNCRSRQIERNREC